MVCWLNIRNSIAQNNRIDNAEAVDSGGAGNLFTDEQKREYQEKYTDIEIDFTEWD